MFTVALKYLLAAVLILMGSPHVLCAQGDMGHGHATATAERPTPACPHCPVPARGERPLSSGTDDGDCSYCTVRSQPASGGPADGPAPLKIELPAVPLPVSTFPAVATPLVSLRTIAAPHVPRAGCALCVLLGHLLF